MTKKAAIAYMRTHDDYTAGDEATLVEVFTALYGRAPDTQDIDDGLWSLCCASPAWRPLRRAGRRTMKRHAKCECGEYMGEACQWSGPRSETVLVEYMPRWLRSSHAAAGNSGAYPCNGAVKLRVERGCARLLLDDPDEAGWASLV